MILENSEKPTLSSPPSYFPQTPTPSSSRSSSETSHDDIPQIERTSTCQSRIQSPTECMLDWLLKILGVLSAILFGIWAPVSYRLQVSGNNSSDEVTDQVMQKIDSMREELELLRDEMRVLGLMRVWELCKGNEGEACARLRTKVDLKGVVGRYVNGVDEERNEESKEGIATQTGVKTQTEMPGGQHHTLSMRTLCTTTTTTIPTPIIPTPIPDTHHDEIGLGPESNSHHPVLSSSSTATSEALRPSTAPHSLVPGIDSCNTFEIAYQYWICGIILCGVFMVQGWRWKKEADRWESVWRIRNRPDVFKR